jgi:hypothetical protein
MNAIMLTGNRYADDELILETLAKLFIEMASLYYDYLTPHIEKISEFTFYLVIYSL